MSELSQEQKRAVALKIKALLAKTTEAGCTEAEAMMAAHKAHELLAKYQLNLSELDLREEGTDEATVIYDDVTHALAGAVGDYCEVKCWTENRQKIKFLGLQSDAFFAEWLMLALSAFVKRKGLDFSLESTKKIFQSDIIEFRAGCSNRICKRLWDEVEARKANAVTGRELLVVKGHLISEAWAKKNLTLGQGRASYRGNAASAAYQAGAAAGDQARFARPVARDEFATKAITGRK